MNSIETDTQPTSYPVRISDSPAELAQAAARRVVTLGREALAARGCFRLALAGGNTPHTLYRVLAEPANRSALDWTHVEVFFSDERDVSPEHSDSNFRMASETLLQHVPIPASNIHPMRTASVSLRRDAARYAAMLRRRVPVGEAGWPQLDLVLLGLGADGHTASLFPGTCVLHERQLTVAAVYVPQQRGWRLTLTLPVLDHARRLLFLVSGKGKAQALAAALSEPREGKPSPVQLLRPQGQVEWFCDRAAADPSFRDDSE